MTRTTEDGEEDVQLFLRFSHHDMSIKSSDKISDVGRFMSKPGIVFLFPGVSNHVRVSTNLEPPNCIPDAFRRITFSVKWFFRDLFSSESIQGV